VDPLPDPDALEPPDVTPAPDQAPPIPAPIEPEPIDTVPPVEPIDTVPPVEPIDTVPPVEPGTVVSPGQVSTLQPDALATRYFYSYDSAFSSLGAVTATTAPSATPSPYRKLYTKHATGVTTLDFEDGTSGASDASALVYVSCSAARCLRLSLRDAEGSVLAVAEPDFSSQGWVTLDVPAALTEAQVRDLTLRVTARSLGLTFGAASISAARVQITS
jgi:hypothetical protein